jgi:hypothetical protein
MQDRLHKDLKGHTKQFPMNSIRRSQIRIPYSPMRTHKRETLDDKPRL